MNYNYQIGDKVRLKKSQTIKTNRVSDDIPFEDDDSGVSVSNTDVWEVIAKESDDVTLSNGYFMIYVPWHWVVKADSLTPSSSKEGQK